MAGDVPPDPEPGEGVGEDLEAFPEAGPVQALSRRIDTADAAATSRGEGRSSRSTVNQSEWRTTGLRLIFSDAGQSRSSCERVTGTNPLADRPARIFDNAWTVPA